MVKGAVLPLVDGLRVELLELRNFRNFKYARFDIEADRVVLTGDNGTGKTNILEALSYLGSSRGLRHARLIEVDRQSNDPLQPWEVKAQVLVGGLLDDVASRHMVSDQSRHWRQISVNGKKAAPRPWKILWLTPDRERISGASASQRRWFLDQLVASFDRDHMQRCNDFERSLRQRQKILEGLMAVQGADRNAWLDGLERQIAATGTAIVAARRALVEELNDMCRSPPLARADLGYPQCALVGGIEDALENDSALAVEEKFQSLLAAARQPIMLDIGPHRSQFIIRRFEGASMTPRLGQDSSTGQQKILTLVVLLAAAHLLAKQTMRAPLLLIDEMMAHLDGLRRQVVGDIIEKTPGQVWMSGADRSLFEVFDNNCQYITLKAL